jgi:very-short-patch-repair endonuclease
METKLRLLLVLAGLPEPEVNVKVRWPDGRVRYRFDLCYRDLKLVVEYDGQHHRADLDQWDHDIVRRDWMDGEGWSFVPVVARGVYRRPDETLERVRAALVRAGAKGLPKRLSAEWRAHFPVLP